MENFYRQLWRALILCCSTTWLCSMNDAHNVDLNQATPQTQYQNVSPQEINNLSSVGQQTDHSQLNVDLNQETSQTQHQNVSQQEMYNLSLVDQQIDQSQLNVDLNQETPQAQQQKNNNKRKRDENQTEISAQLKRRKCSKSELDTVARIIQNPSIDGLQSVEQLISTLSLDKLSDIINSSHGYMLQCLINAADQGKMYVMALILNLVVRDEKPFSPDFIGDTPLKRALEKIGPQAQHDSYLQVAEYALSSNLYASIIGYTSSDIEVLTRNKHIPTRIINLMLNYLSNNSRLSPQFNNPANIFHYAMIRNHSLALGCLAHFAQGTPASFGQFVEQTVKPNTISDVAPFTNKNSLDIAIATKNIQAIDLLCDTHRIYNREFLHKVCQQREEIIVCRIFGSPNMTRECIESFIKHYEHDYYLVALLTNILEHKNRQLHNDKPSVPSIYSITSPILESSLNLTSNNVFDKLEAFCDPMLQLNAMTGLRMYTMFLKALNEGNDEHIGKRFIQLIALFPCTSNNSDINKNKKTILEKIMAKKSCLRSTKMIINYYLANNLLSIEERAQLFDQILYDPQQYSNVDVLLSSDLLEHRQAGKQFDMFFEFLFSKDQHPQRTHLIEMLLENYNPQELSKEALRKLIQENNLEMMRKLRDSFASKNGTLNTIIASTIRESIAEFFNAHQACSLSFLNYFAHGAGINPEQYKKELNLMNFCPGATVKILLEKLITTKDADKMTINFSNASAIDAGADYIVNMVLQNASGDKTTVTKFKNYIQAQDSYVMSGIRSWWQGLNPQCQRLAQFVRNGGELFKNRVIQYCEVRVQQ